MIALLGDALRTLSAKPGRTLSQGLGVALGAGVFVLVLGLGQTIGAQVDDRFDAVAATTVVAGPDSSSDNPVARVGRLDDFVDDLALSQTRAIDGVEAATRFGVLRDQRVRAAVTPALPAGPAQTADVIVADPDLLQVIAARVTGYGFHELDSSFPRQVAVIGRALARDLGVERPGAQISLGRGSVAVIGIIEDAARLPQVLRGVLLSPTTSTAMLPDATFEPGVVVATAPGAAQVVATNLAATLRPQAAEQVRVSAPISPDQLRRSISGDVRRLSLGAAFLVLAAGSVAVGNLMTLSVTQRVPEIGMRRAMGASRRHVTCLVVTEAMVMGAAAGLVGSVVGTWAVLGVTLWQRWTPVLDLWTAGLGLLAGIVGAVIGSLIPAVVAAKIEPAQALRH